MIASIKQLVFFTTRKLFRPFYNSFFFSIFYYCSDTFLRSFLKTRFLKMFLHSIKNLNINFNDVKWTGRFSSGDLITGHVSFDLSKETNITLIEVAMAGKANVHWSTGGGGGGKRRRNRRHYAAKLDFFNFKSVIVQRNSATGGAAKLQPGTHVYPFTCQLPHGDFPSTFHGVCGQILYTLTVSIHRPWHMTKDFVTELNFVNRINTNQPQLQAPLSGSNSMTLCCLWCVSGPIAMTVSVEKKAFIPGETVKVICDFSNASSRTATPKVVLQQKQICYANNKRNKRMVVKNLVCVTGQPVVAHASDVHARILLPVPVLASLTISNCSIIDVDYFIEVSLSVRAAYDLTVLFPIIVCDALVNAQPLLYLHKVEDETFPYSKSR
ncbi:arrestin domain-containing protein 3-like [Pungitius pungitius]|uniref:arrestin domain-containing protein 3-like n=1 Tax=Pungitius pungitius TaxID=134920 RepID=UPI002E131C4F